jgi:hypothetical protein
MLPAMVGCSGEYILTAPDQLAPSGSTTSAVVRLQKQEVFLFSPPIGNAAIRFWVADGPLRGAFTDKNGYAAAAVPVPDKPGLYNLSIAAQDIQGDEAKADFPAYVWPADKPIVAVDLECLPPPGKDADTARAAMAKVAGGANILYFTRRGVREYPALREGIQGNHLPDGPILPWRLEDWTAAKMTSPLPQLRRQFPNLAIGICNSQSAAATFGAVGMECVIVGGGKVKAPMVRYLSWTELAKSGLSTDAQEQDDQSP